jgi:hypothetical protein
MLHFYKLRQDLFAPVPARDVYVKRGPGKGWPEECPPIRAANAYGFDLLANFDVTFTRTRDKTWRATPDTIIRSDFDYSATEENAGAPLAQQYAWFWEKGQQLPHPITDNVYASIANQVKLSTFLFLKTDPNELLYFTPIPNLDGRGHRAVSALVDTDWYPASYPWHAVLELDPAAKRVVIRKGDPICRVIPVRRDTFFAAEMPVEAFDAFFARGQRWLSTHGKFEHESADSPGHVDITRTYVRQQVRSKFVVMT